MTASSTLYTTAAAAVNTYDPSLILEGLRNQAALLHLPPDHFAGRRVVIKPNLVAPMKPDAAATTHPAVLIAVVRFLREYGATDLLLAESPGGLFSETTLKMNYLTSGILAAAEQCALPLNYETEAVTVHASNASVCRTFHVLKPIAEADVIVDLCRLKTHSLTRLSCAVKNLFGVIPGVEKFEMHSAYPTLSAFPEMLVDLCAMLSESHEILAICDAITGMEGNGPTGGTPRDLGMLFMSRNPFALDAAAEELVGFGGTVPVTEAARRRGLCPPPGGVALYGAPISHYAISNFREPDTSSGTFLRRLPDLFGGRLAGFLSPRPKISAERCIGCGVCAASCPRRAIEIIESGAKKRARITAQSCIRCFCCQELCPIHAVDIRKNPIFKIVH